MNYINHKEETGFTLIELLIYIFIAGLVSLFAARAWFDSAVFSMGSEKRVELSTQMEALQYTIERDFEQIGLAFNQKDTSVHSNDDVYMDAASGDFSSFEFENDADTDSIKYRVGKFDANGEADGYQEIELFTQGDSLMRTLTEFDGTGAQTSTSTVVMSTGVQVFNMELGYYNPHSTSGDSIITAIAFDSSSSGANYWSEISSSLESYLFDLDIQGYGFTMTNEDTLISFQLEDGTGTRKEFQTSKGKTYTLKFNIQYNMDYKNSYNYARDSLVVYLKKTTDTTTSVGGVLPIKLIPNSGDQLNTLAFDINPRDTSFIIQVKARLKNISGTPELYMGDVHLIEYNRDAVEYIDNLSTNNADKFAEKMSVNSIRLRLGLYETIGLDTNTYFATKVFSLPNNGVQ